MSSKVEVDAVGDMIDAAERAMQYSVGTTQDGLLLDTMRTDAILRVLGIMGEAVTRLSDETRSRFDTIPWAKIKAMRNHLIHRYDRVDAEIIWETVTVHLPLTVADLRHTHQELLAEQTTPPPEAPV